jgi:iron complex transport system substrate-binding protein
MAMLITTRTKTNAHTLDALAHHAPATDDLLEVADWLGANGSHHLSAIERIELAERVISRRRFLIGAGALALGSVTGCDPQGEAAAPTATVAPTITSATTVVAALDEFAGLSALALGVKPASVFLTFGYTSAKAVFDFAGVQTTPAAPDGVNLESVAALKPTTIIGISIPTTAAAQEKLNLIAPTTVIEYTASWQDQLKVTGATLGRAEAAATLTSQLDGAVTRLKADLAGAGKAGQLVSVISALELDIFALSRTGLVGSMLEQVGLKRPPVQDVATEATNPFIPISAEKIGDHDADTIFLLSGGAYNTDALTASALWTTLGAVKANRIVNVVAELWFSSNAFGLDWIVRDVRAALLDDGAVATEADVVSRWQVFTAARG